MQATAPPRNEETYLRTDNGTEIPVGVLAPAVPVYSDKRGHACMVMLDDKVLDFITSQIVELVEDDFDCIVMITGARRKGKSTLGIQIARKVSQAFSPDNIAFRLEDFSSILEKNPYADPKNGVFPQAFLDEAGVGLYSKEWYATWQRNLVKCLEVIGIKRQICYFILPHARKLTGDIRDEMASMWIDVDTKWKHERGYAELYTGVRDKFKQSIWWKPRCAFKFNPLEDDFWKSYEEKKKLFVNEIAAGKHQSGPNSKDPVPGMIAAEIAKGRSLQDVADEYGTSKWAVWRLVNKLKTASR